MDLTILKKINIIFGFIILIILGISFVCNFIRKNKNENKKDIKKISENFFEKNYIFIWIILFVVAVFTRFYHLNNLLNGLHVDEAGMGYDAYCIANFGVDRFLNKLPVYMINFGGGQSALYTYVTAIWVKIFGLSTFSTRLAGTIFSLVGIVIASCLIKKCNGKKSALFYMLFMIICPWHIMQSRFGLDCNLLASMVIIDFYAIILSKKWYHYIITGVLFGVSLYTYALSYIIIPTVLFLTLIYMLYTKKIKFKNIIIMGIPIAILAAPLMLMLLVNNGYLEQINGFITIPKIYNYRAGEIGLANISENIKNLKSIFTNDKFIYNSIPQFGTLYLCSLPLLFVGIIIEIIELFKNIRMKKFKLGTLMLFLFIGNVVVICLTPTNVNKANSIYISSIYFILDGVRYVYKNFKTGFIAIMIIYLLMSIAFFTYYFRDYSKEHTSMELVNNELIGLYNKIDEIDKNENKVYMELRVTQPWIYQVFQSKVSPYDLQSQKHEDTVDYWTNMISYGRYYWGLPKEITYDGIYVMVKNTNEDLKKNLISHGYQEEEYGRYVILYRREI